MLFIGIQTHTPTSCPLNNKKPEPLWDIKNKKVVVKNIYACPPGHVAYFILEAEDFSAIQEFFAPGTTRSTVEIKPVIEAK